MKTAGIICEYNPFHPGHAYHIEKTKEALGGDAYVVCVMSGNFVQRGDFAVFNKHARAKMAVMCGADVVIELPAAYALQSAREFASAGVFLLDMPGVCDFISFGSESGNLKALCRAAKIIKSQEAEKIIKINLKAGLPYATAQQKAADALLGKQADILKTPNNILAIEYINALYAQKSPMQPMTFKRVSGAHDGDNGWSASSLRRAFKSGVPAEEQMPAAAAAVCIEEITQGRKPVFFEDAGQMIMSRLRTIGSFADIPGATDGLDRRFMRAASYAPTVDSFLGQVKTKRYAMSRIRRVLMCAVLGISNKDIRKPPPYIRVLAMNGRGREVIKKIKKQAQLPVIIKPSSVKKLGRQSVRLFEKESSATDFYSLLYSEAEQRTGGAEWRSSPVVINP